MTTATLQRTVLASTLLLSACGGGGGGGNSATPSDTPPPIISFSHVFPQGDATAAQGTAWDIVGVKTTLSGQFGDGAGQLYDTLRVDVTFAQNIANALPAPGQSATSGSQLGVTMSFDTDENASTGVYDTCNVSSGVTPFEYITSFGIGSPRLADGNYSIVSDTGGPIYSGTPNPPEEAVTAVSGRVFSQTFFLPAIDVAAGSSVPKIGLDVGAFNGLDELTDCVPIGNGEMFTDHS
jgi:hypothetical protein